MDPITVNKTRVLTSWVKNGDKNQGINTLSKYVYIGISEWSDYFSHAQDVEIKKMGGNATYGFILYYDLMSAVNAKQYMDGHNLKGNNIRVRRNFLQVYVYTVNLLLSS